ncbi:MAG: signal peptidase II [Ruminococcus sp.]|nr:signal peptidase II [Ruminococcus sp.]
MSILLIITILVLVVIDQLVKHWAVDVLQPVRTMDFIHFGNFRIINLTYLENDGAIFGSMSGQRWFLVGFTSLVVVAAFVFMLMSLKRSKLLATSIMLFVAGGIGNLIDRIRFGYVVDMFEIKLFRFAIFNVADICVTIGFVLVFIYVFFIEPKIAKEKAEVKNE